MIDGRSVLAIIPARGGSRGLPGKNVVDLNGAPLIAWTLRAAQASQFLDRVIVSTDDAAIADAARDYGGEIPFMRPDALARDDTPGVAPLLHAMRVLETYDYVVCLQPTSPARIAEDIDGTIARCIEGGGPACVTVCPSRSKPQWMYRVDASGRLAPLSSGPIPLRRQDMAATYDLNGAVYVAESSWFFQYETFLRPETLGYVMPVERSIDIDSALDLAIARALMPTNLPTAPAVSLTHDRNESDHGG